MPTVITGSGRTTFQVNGRNITFEGNRIWVNGVEWVPVTQSRDASDDSYLRPDQDAQTPEQSALGRAMSFLFGDSAPPPRRRSSNQQTSGSYRGVDVGVRPPAPPRPPRAPRPPRTPSRPEYGDVGGDLTLQDVSGDVHIRGDVGGNLTIQSAGNVHIGGDVGGNATVHSGLLEVRGDVGGNATNAHVRGDVGGFRR